MNTFFIQEKDPAIFPVALPHERILKITQEQKSEQQQLLAQANLILTSLQEKGIEDIEGAESVGECISTLLGKVAYADENRKAFKANFVGACKAIDTVAVEYAAPLELAADKLKLFLLGFLQEQRKQALSEVKEKGFTETPAAIHGAYIRENWDFEVTDAKVAQAANPEMWELVPKKSAIIASLKIGGKLAGIKPVKKEILVVEKS